MRKPASRAGFGSKLIGTIVPSELHGTAKIQNTEPGFRYELTAPLNFVQKEKRYSAVDFGRRPEAAALEYSAEHGLT